MALQASLYWPPLQIERNIQTRFLSILTIPRMVREVRPENTVPPAVRLSSPLCPPRRRPHVLPRIIWDERCMRSGPIPSRGYIRRPRHRSADVAPVPEATLVAAAWRHSGAYATA